MIQASHPVTLAMQPEPTDHSLGADHARVTVVEYGDFECPSCKVAVQTPKLLLDRFPNRIRFIFRHFPLQDAHPHALMAAEVAETAAAQGKFWEMHDLLFQNQAHLKDKDLYRHAGQAGLDLPTTVAPFILRGVSLFGIDSVMCPKPRRRTAWERLARDLDRGKLAEMTTEIRLAEVPDAARRIMQGQVRGRTLIKIAG